MACENTKQLKILSLDGGGVRGLSSLMILKRIMATVGSKMNRKDLQPYEYFDLIGGTSTGGIIALMLGRMRMSVSDCIDEYQRLGSIVFGKPQGPNHEHMFDADILVRETKAVVGKYLRTEDEPLLDPLGEDGCKTILFTLPSKNAVTQTATALRTYINEDKDPQPDMWTIWEAIRATSAATTIFKPFKHGLPGKEIEYIDAAFGSGFINLNLDVGIFLSLGTGMGKVIRMDNETMTQKLLAKVHIPLKAVMAMEAIVTETDKTHRGVAEQFGMSSLKYHRFNVNHGIQDIELFDHKKREELQTDTKAYLQQFETERQLKQCVASMKELLQLKPSLLDDRQEEETVYSLGVGGSIDEYKLAERLKKLRIKGENFERHQKVWEGEIYRVESQYHKHLYKMINQDPQVGKYLWNAVIQADLLEERGREVAAYCYPNPDCPQLTLMDVFKAMAYYTPQDETPERNSARLGLANDDLTMAFSIYRQLLSTVRSFWDENNFAYCWIAKRMGGILEIWGCRREACDLYSTARDGITRVFGKNHWSVKKLQEKLDNLSCEL